MSLIQTGPIIFGSTDAFLWHHRLLAANKTCTRQVNTEVLHAFLLLVATQHCENENGKIYPMESLGFAQHAKQPSRSGSQVSSPSLASLSPSGWSLSTGGQSSTLSLDCMDEAEVDKRSAIDIYQWLREVCTTRLLRDLPIVLGGQGVIVEVDESLFRHKEANVIIHYSCKCNTHITVEGRQPQKCGYSALSIHHTSLHLGTCK